MNSSSYADIDWSQEKGIADEQHFNAFIVDIGGDLVAPLITREGVLNADYLLRKHKIVAEHKIIETDFTQTPEVLAKAEVAVKRFGPTGETPDEDLLSRELYSILRIPLRRIIEKANRQIRSTKQELKLADYRGVAFLVNDSLKSLQPAIVRDIVYSVIKDRERFRSVDCVVYFTNHYVELAESPDACLVWGPIYKGCPSLKLSKSIDEIGSQWSSFMETRRGPFDSGYKSDFVDWARAHVVTGMNRVEPFKAKP